MVFNADLLSIGGRSGRDNSMLIDLASSHNNRQRADVVETCTLNFFDANVVICSNSPVFLEQMIRLHQGVLVIAPETGGTPRYQLTVEYYSRPTTAFDHPTFVLDGRAYPLPGQPEIASYLDGIITMHASQLVRSHLLIHAGAVAYKGQGVILAADSMHGKTTLTLELLRRGFCLLSDDVAAVGREDGLLHAYPRALLVRPGSLELAGLQAPPTGGVWNGKGVLYAEDLGLSHCTDPVPVTHIIVMQDTPPERGRNADQSRGTDFILTLSALSPTILQAIRGLDPVMQAAPILDSPLPALHLRTTSAVQAMDQIQALCDERRVLILDYVDRARRPPPFDRPARLEPMSKHEALMAMAHGFRAGHRSALLTGERTPGELMMELADIAAAASCHRLTVGPLTASADLICQLLETKRKP